MKCLGPNYFWAAMILVATRFFQFLRYNNNWESGFQPFLVAKSKFQ